MTIRGIFGFGEDTDWVVGSEGEGEFGFESVIGPRSGSFKRGGGEYGLGISLVEVGAVVSGKGIT